MKTCILLFLICIVTACQYTPKKTDKRDSTLKANLHADSVAEAKIKADAYRKAHFTAADSAAAPKMIFEEKSCNFGTLIKGQTAHHIFKFTNTGPVPLIISSAVGSCGCTTVPGYPHKPILPGKSGVITVDYNSADAKGMITQIVSIKCNGIPDEYILRLNGKVKVPESK